MQPNFKLVTIIIAIALVRDKVSLSGKTPQTRNMNNLRKTEHQHSSQNISNNSNSHNSAAFQNQRSSIGNNSINSGNNYSSSATNNNSSSQTRKIDYSPFRTPEDINHRKFNGSIGINDNQQLYYEDAEQDQNANNEQEEEDDDEDDIDDNELESIVNTLKSEFTNLKITLEKNQKQQQQHQYQPQLDRSIRSNDTLNLTTSTITNPYPLRNNYTTNTKDASQQQQQQQQSANLRRKSPYKLPANAINTTANTSKNNNNYNDYDNLRKSPNYYNSLPTTSTTVQQKSILKGSAVNNNNNSSSKKSSPTQQQQQQPRHIRSKNNSLDFKQQQQQLQQQQQQQQQQPKAQIGITQQRKPVFINKPYINPNTNNSDNHNNSSNLNQIPSQQIQEVTLERQNYINQQQQQQYNEENSLMDQSSIPTQHFYNNINISNHHNNYDDKLGHSEYVGGSAYKQQQQQYDYLLKSSGDVNTSTEERLFKFSPLSSKKFDDDENQLANSTRSFQNNSMTIENTHYGQQQNNNNNNSSIIIGSSNDNNNNTPLTYKNRTSLNNSQIVDTYNRKNADLFHPLRSSQSPIQTYQQQHINNSNDNNSVNNNLSNIFNNNNLSRISQNDNNSTTAGAGNAATADNQLNSSIIHYQNNNASTAITRQNTVVHQQQQQQQLHKRENSLIPVAYKTTRDQTPQTAIRYHQRIPSTSYTQTKPQTSSISIQTEPRGPLMLSPFETYDLLFVRDTINNLNFDNEILNQNVEDLRNGFMYLLQKHKQLMHEYDKECQNKQIIEGQRKRISELIIQNEQTQVENLQLKLKIKSMQELIQLSVQEQFYSMQDDQILIDQLTTENSHLRDLLTINQHFQHDLNLEEIHKTLQESERELENYEYQQMQTENLRKMREIEKIRMELSQEIEDILRKEYEEKFQKLADETALMIKTANNNNNNNQSQNKPSLQDEGTQIFSDQSNGSDDNMMNTNNINENINMDDSLSNIEQKIRKSSPAKQNNDSDSDPYQQQNPALLESNQLHVDKDNIDDNDDEGLNATDEFKELFDGQPITEEEMEFIMELKKMQSDQFNQPQKLDKHDLQQVANDFAAQMDDDEDSQDEEEDDEEEDEDVKSLQRLLKQSKEGGYYQSNNNNNSNDNQSHSNDVSDQKFIQNNQNNNNNSDEDDYYNEQRRENAKQNKLEQDEQMFEQIRKQNQALQHQSDSLTANTQSLLRKRKGAGVADEEQYEDQDEFNEDDKDQHRDLDFNDYMDDFEPDEEGFGSSNNNDRSNDPYNYNINQDNLKQFVDQNDGSEDEDDDDLDLTDGKKDALRFSQEQLRKEQQFLQELQNSGLPNIPHHQGGNNNAQEFRFDDDDDDEEQFFKELAQDFQTSSNNKLGSSKIAAIQSLSNPSLDQSKIKQSLVRQSNNNNDDEILFDLQREEAKEEEYDYFDVQDENLRGNNDYHVMDDNIENNNDDDDEEMLDEDEIKHRKQYMLKELQDKFDQDDRQQQQHQH